MAPVIDSKVFAFAIAAAEAVTFGVAASTPSIALIASLPLNAIV